MAINPEAKGALIKFTNAAEAIIYNPDRLDQLLPMLDDAEGAIQAVKTIIGVIEQKKPVPPQIAPLLAVNVYLLLVDMAKETSGETPNPQVIKDVTVKLLSQMHGAYAESKESPEQEQMEPAQEQMQEQQAGVEAPMQRGLVGRQMGV